MHDIKAIRENPERYEQAWARKYGLGIARRLIELDVKRRSQLNGLQESQARRKKLSEEYARAVRSNDEAILSALASELDRTKQNISDFEDASFHLEQELEAMLMSLPNVPSSDVPSGGDEHGNKQIKEWGTWPTRFGSFDHVHIGEKLGLLDFESAAKMSGSRFVVLKGQLARLERAIGQFMLDLQTSMPIGVDLHGYTEISPPLLVRANALEGTSQLPKFEEDLFKISLSQPSPDGLGQNNSLYLIPTAEVSLTNIVREKTLLEEELPLRLTALTACFRAEAGSAGRDTRGMIRQHQFYKVELVSITTPEQSEAEHERMTASAEAVLEQLGLPYRRMLLCTGDMGFSSQKTYDLEVLLPSQSKYREISSCSNCGDFQARRMKATYKPRAVKETKRKTELVHTLNGSGLAVGRTLVAIMENFQEGDGRIAIPKVLQPYMNKLTHIG